MRIRPEMRETDKFLIFWAFPKHKFMNVITLALVESEYFVSHYNLTCSLSDYEFT